MTRHTIPGLGPSAPQGASTPNPTGPSGPAAQRPTGAARGKTDASSGVSAAALDRGVHAAEAGYKRPDPPIHRCWYDLEFYDLEIGTTQGRPDDDPPVPGSPFIAFTGKIVGGPFDRVGEPAVDGRGKQYRADASNGRFLRQTLWMPKPGDFERPTNSRDHDSKGDWKMDNAATFFESALGFPQATFPDAEDGSGPIGFFAAAELWAKAAKKSARQRKPVLIRAECEVEIYRGKPKRTFTSAEILGPEGFDPLAD